MLFMYLCNFYSKTVLELYHLALLKFIVPPIILLVYAYEELSELQEASTLLLKIPRYKNAL